MPTLLGDNVEHNHIRKNYTYIYIKGLANHGYDYSHEGRKRMINHLINAVKVIQQAWKSYNNRPEI